MRCGFEALQIILLLSFGHISAMSQPSLEPAAYFARLGREQGLSHYTVSDVIQDQAGFVWLATNSGLDRFDGHKFVSYRQKSAGLTEDRISCLFEDEAGRLWVGTDGSGLNGLSRNRSTWEHAIPEPGQEGARANRIVSIAKSSDADKIWVGTLKSILGYDIETGNFDRSLANLVGDLDGVFAILEWQGDLLLGHTNGLMCIDLQSHLVQNFDIGTVREIHMDRHERLWLGSSDFGLLHLDQLWKDALTHAQDYAIDGFERVRDLVITSEDHLWIATSKGLAFLDANKKDVYWFRHNPQDSSSLSYNNVNAVMIDDSGGLWAATWGGGVSLLDKRISRFSRVKNDAAQGEVMVMHQDRQGRVWVGTWGDGLAKLELDPDGDSVYGKGKEKGSGLNADTVTAILEDKKGQLWFGTRGAGLCRYIESEDRFESYQFGENVFARVNMIHALYEHQSGSLFIGTSGGGLVLFDPVTQSHVVFEHDDQAKFGLSDADVWDIEDAGHGRVWLATSSGLNRFNPENSQFEIFTHDENQSGSLPHNRLNCLFTASEGTLWVGTEGGGFALVENSETEPRFKTYGKGHGLESDVVQSMLQDQVGHLWIATDQGLSKFDPNTEFFPHFHREDGLQRQGYMTQSALRHGNDLWFGGFEGITVVHPLRLNRALPKPRVALTDFLLFNRSVAIASNEVPTPLTAPIHQTPHIILDYESHPLAFEFAILEFVHRSYHSFAYRLDGLDQDWIQSDGEIRRASYSQLKPASYVFRVRGANAEGVWSEHDAAIQITILPPWWMTWWARLLGALIAVGIGLMVHLSRVVRINQSRRLLEHKVTQRTTELAQVNQQLLEASRTDFLTDLPNRRGFSELAQRELTTSSRSGLPLVLGIIDLDFFKRINDEHGHDCGDLALKNVSNLVRKELRARDLVARWGGEEFVFLLPDTNMPGALVSAEKLRASIETSDWRIRQYDIRLTVTIGLALVDPATGIEDALLRADEALYQGKQGGRNQVREGT